MSSREYRNRLRNENASERVEGACCQEPCIECRDGNTVCINCGTVTGREIVGGALRIFTDERRRTEPRWRGFGPRTILPNQKVDSKGNQIGAKEKALFKRLSKIQQSRASSIEGNFYKAKPKLKMLVSKLNIPGYIEGTAWRIYVEAAKRQLTWGRLIDGFIGASLYAAIRVHEFPRLLGEVSDASMASRHTIIKSLGLIVKEILPDLKLRYRPITAEQLVFRLGNDLGLTMEIQKKALDLLKTSIKGGLRSAGKDPKGFAGSALYMAALSTIQRKSEAKISDLTGNTRVTLRSRIKEIYKNL